MLSRWRQLITKSRRYFSPTLVVGLACILYVFIVLQGHDYDPKSFIVIGSRFSHHDLQGKEGYDGQFAYQIALDPGGGWRFIDIPSYRYQRILYPLLARFLALGDPRFIPYTLIIVNMAAIVGGTYVTERLLQLYGVSRWYAIICGLYAGQLLALRLSLNEPLSQALVQTGIYSYERKRPEVSALFFCLAALAKETALVFVGGYALYLLVSRQIRTAAWFTAGTAFPLLLYQLFLKWWLGDFGLGAGGAGATPFEIIPFQGIFAIGRVSVQALLLFLVILTPFVIFPTLLCFGLTMRDIIKRDWHPLTFALLANCIMMFTLPHSTYREILAVLRLSIGLVMTTVLYGGLKGSKRTLNYSMLWLGSLVFLTKE